MKRKINKKKSSQTKFNMSLQPGVSSTKTSSILLAHATRQASPVDTQADDLSKRLLFANGARDQGHLDIAENAYLDTLKKYPRDAKALLLYGLLLNFREKFSEALRVLKKANKILPKQPEICNALAHSFKSMGRTQDAFKIYNTAIDVAPDYAPTYVNMGILYRQIGNFEEATACFKRAIDIAPSTPEAWNGFSRSQKFKKLPDKLEALESIANSSKLSSIQKKHAYFALAKIHDDVGIYDKAFTFYAKGNMQNPTRANSTQDTAYMHQIANEFNPLSMPNMPRAQSGDASPIPLFVLGMPRSGTTLVEQILATHEDVEWGGELHYFTGITSNFQHYTTEKNGKYPQSVTRLTPDGITKIRRDFFKQFNSMRSDRNPSALMITDKTPLNFLYIGLIALAFPEARIINCQRDPMDNGLSIFMTDFANNMPFTTDLPAIGHYIREYQKLMHHWHGLDILPILDIEYENLIYHHESECRRLINFCGLDWDERCLSFHKNERQVTTPSDWQVRQPIFDKSIDRWKNYEKDLTVLHDIVNPTTD